MWLVTEAWEAEQALRVPTVRCSSLGYETAHRRMQRLRWAGFIPEITCVWHPVSLRGFSLRPGSVRPSLLAPLWPSAPLHTDSWALPSAPQTLSPPSPWVSLPGGSLALELPVANVEPSRRAGPPACGPVESWLPPWRRPALAVSLGEGHYFPQGDLLRMADSLSGFRYLAADCPHLLWGAGG